MKPLLSDSNALFVVILSHGLQGEMVMAADCEFHIYDLIKMFTPEEIKEMATRPKIFIIQACRGDQHDSGSILKHLKETLEYDQINVVTKETPFKYPNYADMCIAFSSHHGHVSFRSTSEGSWFIQSLCDVLESIDLKENHLMDILAETNWQVAQRDSSMKDPNGDKQKQVSSSYTTLTKKFYLTRDNFGQLYRPENGVNVCNPCDIKD